MAQPPRSEVTELLLAWRNGDGEAQDKLTPLVYDELHRLAHGYMHREGPGHVLQTTALVHEAYLRLVGLDVEWRGKNHFFAIAANLMRRILVDAARRSKAGKRGGEALRVTLDEHHLADRRGAELLEMNDALENLASVDERKSRILELRFFAGLTIRETADFLEVSSATVEREYRLAKAWLASVLESPDPAPAP